VTIENGKRIANELKAHDWSYESVVKGTWISPDFAQLRKNAESYEPGSATSMFDAVRLVLPAGAPAHIHQLLNKNMAVLQMEYPGIQFGYAFVDAGNHTFDEFWM
jgi:hypothetical protein